MSLGPAGTVYTLCAPDSPAYEESLEVARHLWTQAEATNVRWPAATGQGKDFFDGLLSFARRCRSQDSTATGKCMGFLGGREENYNYQVKGCCRGMALVAEDLVPTLFDNTPMSVILEITPDQNKHCEPILGMSGKQARLALGMPSMWISMWCCLCGWMKKDHQRRALDYSDSDLLNCLDRWLEEKDSPLDPEDPPFPPGPRAFGERLDKEADEL